MVCINIIDCNSNKPKIGCNIELVVETIYRYVHRSAKTNSQGWVIFDTYPSEIGIITLDGKEIYNGIIKEKLLLSI